ncbi:unnamed protein product [Phytomonas sp. EM1]|nr:unnamed protein product [Phytomonas sp. EM1]|eukprot:CCW62677.1 unnamed protein product [Phytomonas sp. isolate EM1]
MCSSSILIPSTHRYFNCFYDSFRAPNRKQIEGMQIAVLQAEKRCRLILGCAEEKERSVIARSFGYCLHHVQPQLLSSSSLGVVPEEEVHRRLIDGEFFDKLLEVCVMEECLSRVEMVLRLEESVRKQLLSFEVQHRIMAMRREKERLSCISTNMDSLPHSRDIVPPLDRTFEAMLLLQEAEKEARLAIQRQQFLIAGSLNHYSAIGVKANQQAQTRYEILSYPLERETFSRLNAEEARERTSIMHDSRIAFRALAAEEATVFCLM